MCGMWKFAFTLQMVVLMAVCHQITSKETNDECVTDSDCFEGSTCTHNEDAQKQCIQDSKVNARQVRSITTKYPDIRFVYTRHSQANVLPSCPSGTIKMWEGYSLLYVEGNGRSNHQDLGLSGSCIQRYSTMPFLFCDINDQCHYASRSDKSYWLSSNIHTSRRPVNSSDIQNYISRCVVCDATGPYITVHSQALNLPDCPVGWRSVWTGYSFLMYSGEGSSGGGQPLSSPGSCLEEFRTIPFIQCNGATGTCFRYASEHSFWLATINTIDQFKTPVPETLTAGNLRTRVSRCCVCTKA